MKKLLSLIALAAVFTAGPVSAACYADYKAKRDNPLRLHYGVIELADMYCSDRSAAQNEIATRISTDGWTLLKVQSIFGADGLKEREASAGKFYLKY